MYAQRVDRATPSCLIFLVDQSASMYDPMAGTETPKSVVVAEQLNSTVMELIQRCSKSHTEPPRPYFAVSVIGYRTDQHADAIVDSCITVPGQRGDLAWTTDLVQFIGIWQTGEISGVLRGRYELLWMIAGLAVLLYLLADRITLLGLGEDRARSLGLDYRATVLAGLAKVALTVAVL